MFPDNVEFANAENPRLFKLGGILHVTTLLRLKHILPIDVTVFGKLNTPLTLLFILDSCVQSPQAEPPNEIKSVATLSSTKFAQPANISCGIVFRLRGTLNTPSMLLFTLFKLLHPANVWLVTLVKLGDIRISSSSLQPVNVLIPNEVMLL